MKKLALCLLAAVSILGMTRARADDLSNILDPSAKVEKIAHGFAFTEGPVWHPGGWLLFSDIPGDTIYKWKPGLPARRGHMGLPTALVGSLQVYRRPSGNANGLALDSQGRLVACEHSRRVTRSDGDTDPVVLAEKIQGKRLNSPNDLAISREGSIYFTDPPYGIWDAKKRELDFSGVYRIAADGKLSVVQRDIQFPNGLAFSPDETKLYVVDSGANQIRVHEVNPDGSLERARVFADVKLAGSEEGPDGIKVDAQGRVFCAGPDGVWILSPDGKLLGKIPTPEVPSNLAFGGADRSTLYITARKGLYRIQLRTSAPG